MPSERAEEREGRKGEEASERDEHSRPPPQTDAEEEEAEIIVSEVRSNTATICAREGSAAMPCHAKAHSVTVSLRRPLYARRYSWYQKQQR